MKLKLLLLTTLFINPLHASDMDEYHDFKIQFTNNCSKFDKLSYKNVAPHFETIIEDQKSFMEFMSDYTYQGLYYSSNNINGLINIKNINDEAISDKSIGGMGRPFHFQLRYTYQKNNNEDTNEEIFYVTPDTKSYNLKVRYPFKSMQLSLALNSSEECLPNPSRVELQDGNDIGRINIGPVLYQFPNKKLYSKVAGINIELPDEPLQDAGILYNDDYLWDEVMVPTIHSNLIKR